MSAMDRWLAAKPAGVPLSMQHVGRLLGDCTNVVDSRDAAVELFKRSSKVLRHFKGQGPPRAARWHPHSR